MRAKTERYWILAAALALAACVPILAQSGEGYDPMLQITHQFAHPNILIAQDVSGSMAYNIAGTDVGQDSTGLPYWVYEKWNSGACSRKNDSFKYTLVMRNPSRLCILKNALGNAVTLYTNQKPATWPTFAGWTYHANDGNGNPYWDKTIPCTTGDQPPPFTAPTDATASDYLPGNAAGNPAIIASIQAPQNLVGNTSGTVNWGLMTWSAPGGNAAVTNVQDVNADDSNQAAAVTTILNSLRLQANGGIGANGNTPASYALNKAKESLNRTYTTGYNGGPDPKVSCNRLYAVIFVTDGESNTCNPSSGTWGCTSATNIAKWADYPAGRTNELFLKTGDSDSNCTNTTVTRMRAQTFVIGVSDQVARCELNLDAYFGRTDASSGEPATWSGNTRLPQNTSGATSTANYSTTSDYAYFANSASALKAAFAAIVASVAVGDYTTGAPVAATTSTSGSTVFLTSAEFPSWRGHVYAFDTTKLDTDPNYLMWDAGAVLTSQTSGSRFIYTWDSAGALVPVTASTTTQLQRLQTIAAAFTPGFTGTLLTANVVDFIRGNNGAGASRPWKLGPVVNSTPAVIEKPERFKQALVQDHSNFETTYATRENLLYSGSDDGMFHAFATKDLTIGGVAYPKGSEVFAILPPNLLARQVDLFTNYDAAKKPVGQPTMPADHLYGAANSPRFGDVWFPSPTPGAWKTVLFLTEGPGGDMVAALDVTDPVSLLKANQSAAPFGLLWYRRGGTVTSGNTVLGLKTTWSLPAFGSTTNTTARGLLGSGYDSVNATTTPYAFIFDPVDGTFASGGTLSNATSPYVRNQAFADSVIYSRTAKAFYPDNLVTQAVQADLNGRLWFTNGTGTNWGSPFVGVDARGVAGQSQPIYYSPSVGGYRRSGVAYDLYAFASGTFYEKDTDINGPATGTTGFIPSLFVAATADQAGSAVANNKVLQIPLTDITYVDSAGTTKHLGPKSQVVASPLMLIPAEGSTANPVILFLCYDPDSAAACAGESFVVKLQVSLSSTGAASIAALGAFSAGEGAGSGFAISGSKVIVAKSAVGAGKRAGVSDVPGVNPTSGFSSPTPIWWRELQ